jgi:hypothetical protein
LRAAAHRAAHRPLAPGSGFGCDDYPCPLAAASVRWNISFPAPRPFHLGACKRRQQITDQSSIKPSSTAAAASPQSSAAFSSQRSLENHPPPKPLPRQIPIAGQPLTAFPRVRSSEASRRRPPIPGPSLAPGRHPKPFPRAAIQPTWTGASNVPFKRMRRKSLPTRPQRARPAARQTAPSVRVHSVLAPRYR